MQLISQVAGSEMGRCVDGDGQNNGEIRKRYVGHMHTNVRWGMFISHRTCCGLDYPTCAIPITFGRVLLIRNYSFMFALTYWAETGG
jgi:hypothetical protein